MELLSKITVATIKAQPKPHSVEETHNVCSIYGMLRRYTVGQSSYGEFLKFQGSVEATNLATGEIYKSGNLILPNIISGILQGAVDSIEGDGEVEFGILIGVKPSPKTNTGYEYTVQPLIETQEADALVALRDKMQAQLKALPAPDAPKAKGKK